MPQYLSNRALSFTRLFRVVAVIVVLFASSSVWPSDVAETVQAYCDTLVGHDVQSQYRARDTLARLPTTVVLPIIISRIESDPKMEKSSNRIPVYHVLHDINAQQDTLGRRVLGAGLRDQSVRYIALSALSKAKGEPAVDASRILLEYLRLDLDNKVPIDTSKFFKSVIQKLALLGQASMEGSPLLRELINDKNNGMSIRVTALGALFDIQGLAGFLESIGDPNELNLGDTVGLSGWQVVQQLIRRNDLACTFMLNETDRAAFYHFAEGYLDHQVINEPDGEVAEAAIGQFSSIVSEIQLRRYEHSSESVKWWSDQLSRIEEDAVTQKARSSAAATRAEFEKTSE